MSILGCVFFYVHVVLSHSSVSPSSAPDYFDESSIIRNNLDRVPYWKTMNVSSILENLEKYFALELNLQLALQEKFELFNGTNQELILRLVELLVIAALSCPHKGVYDERVRVRMCPSSQAIMERIIVSSWNWVLTCRVGYEAPAKSQSPLSVMDMQTTPSKATMLQPIIEEESPDCSPPQAPDTPPPVRPDILSSSMNDRVRPVNNQHSFVADHSQGSSASPGDDPDPFIVSEADIDVDEIADFLQLPESQVAKVDHTVTTPGKAFSSGYVQRRVLVREPAKESILLAFRKFHYRKSFWAIVPKLPQDTKYIRLADHNRRLRRLDTNEGDTLLDEYDDSMQSHWSRTRSATAAVPQFLTTRMRRSVVFVHSSEYSNTDFFDDILVPDLALPDSYDLLINPYFFEGKDYHEEVAEDRWLGVWERGEFYCSTLAPDTAKGFVLCFGPIWQELVEKVQKRCRDGYEIGVGWPSLLDSIHGSMGPAPDYFDIPSAYCTYAAGLMLGMHQDVGIREVWAAGGLVGMYSFARRMPGIGSDSYEREIATLFAMLREATYGCRSAKMGVVLLHYIPHALHDDYRTFCTLPWSSLELIGRRKERSKSISMSITRLSRSKIQYSTWKLNRPSVLSKGSERFNAVRRGLSRVNLNNNGVQAPRQSRKRPVKLLASRYVVTVRPKVRTRRPFMNFVASVGTEMVGVPFPSLILDRMSVISECFENAEQAKNELRDFSNREMCLPGAVIRAANFAERGGGVLNVSQPRNMRNGHVVWMKKYSYWSAVGTIVLIIIVSFAAWLQQTGVYHFLLALTIISKIRDEVSVYGTAWVLLRGRKFGYKMYQDGVAKFIVPVSLGVVEAAFELSEEGSNLPNYFVVFAGTVAGGVVLFTMLARLQFQQNEGSTFREIQLRDGSIECLLSGENGTGHRSIDHPDIPGVGPLQAQVFEQVDYNGSGLASSSTFAPYHVSGNWMVAGLLQRNRDLDFGVSAAACSEHVHGCGSDPFTV